MRICVLGSGSGGNATFVEDGSTRLLIDAGLRVKDLTERLARVGIDPSMLDGILVSHEHHDHVQGVEPLARKWSLPVYISPRALDYAGAELQQVRHLPIAADVPVQIGSITVTPFSIPHDSVDPLAFSLRAGNSRVCVVTDIGYLPEAVRTRIAKADALVIESNHDTEMLRTGPYPWPLKQRVMSNLGHLSNEALAFFFDQYFDGTGRKIMLIHLSKQNNHPQMAYVSAVRALEKNSQGTEVHLSLQDEISDILEL